MELKKRILGQISTTLYDTLLNLPSIAMALQKMGTIMANPISPELSHRANYRLLTIAWLILACSYSSLHRVQAAVAAESTYAPLKIVNPHQLPDSDIPATRTPLGLPNDYKPWIARLSNGELLIVAFYGRQIDGKRSERAVFWRSRDGGKSWGERDERANIQGREFALNVLTDGTLIMTCHFLANDRYNQAGYAYSKIFRSADNGSTWTEQRIGPEGFPPGKMTMADWTTFEIPDPQKPQKTLTMLGVSLSHGGKLAPPNVFLWRSRDSGQTWDKKLNPDTKGWIDVDGFFCQSTTYRTASGKLLHPVRVDRTGPYWHIAGTPDKLKTERGDNGDRSMLWESTDNGHSWQKHHGDGRFGHYGEMYARFLKLTDGRLLLTFTVRSNSTDGYPLGVRGIVSYDDGETWNFKQDRIIIAYVNHGVSGGGFGNTVQLDDGKLVSCYSYRGEDGKPHVEAVRWQLPPSKG